MSFAGKCPFCEMFKTSGFTEEEVREKVEEHWKKEHPTDLLRYYPYRLKVEKAGITDMLHIFKHR